MQILEAYQLAARLHNGQVDKAGHAYIEHLTRVFLRVLAGGGDADQQIAALLHDAIEDGKATVQELLDMGVPQSTMALINTLTKPKGMDYMEYLAGVKSEPKAVLVKHSDLQDNSDPIRLAELPDAIAQRLSKKYAQATQFMLSNCFPKR